MRLKALVVAPCLDGDDVGEAWSSYHWVRGLAEHHDLTVLGYHKRGHRSLSEQLPGVRVVEWRDLPLVGRFERLNSMLKPAYPIFHRRARRWIRAALARGERFDVGHQLAPLAARYPSPLAGLGIPWVLGPLAGGLSDPEGFSGGAPAPWFTHLRKLDGLRARLDPWLRASYRDASEIVTVAPYMREVLAPMVDQEHVHESETGVLACPDPRQSREPGPLRILHVGRMVRTKGLAHGLRALATLKHLEWTLDVVGAGEELEPCRQLAVGLGLDQRVTFHGRVPRDAVDDYYRRSDVFLFPSYREPSGNVVFEAMAHGLCVVCCARGGPGHVVAPGLGFAVPVETPEQLERDLAGHLRVLLAKPSLATEVGAAGQEFLQKQAVWPAKVERMSKLYQGLVVPA